MSGQALRLPDWCSLCWDSKEAADRDNEAKAREARQAALDAIEDPIERLLTVLGRYTRVSATPYERVKRHLDNTSAEVRQVIGSLWPDAGDPWRIDLDMTPPWNVDEIARWFAERAQRMGVPSDGNAAQFLGKSRHSILSLGNRVPMTPRSGWRFVEGAESPDWFGGGPFDAYVTVDGTILPAGYHLRVLALVDMASKLGLS
jgi:hypothetical protein